MKETLELLGAWNWGLFFHLISRNEPPSYLFWLHSGEQEPAPDNLITERKKGWNVCASLGGTLSLHLATHLCLISREFLVKSNQSPRLSNCYLFCFGKIHKEENNLYILEGKINLEAKAGP